MYQGNSLEKLVKTYVSRQLLREAGKNIRIKATPWRHQRTTYVTWQLIGEAGVNIHIKATPWRNQ